MNGCRLVVGALMFGVTIAGACTTPPAPATLTVLAASSLSSSMPDLTDAWKAAHAETAIVAASGSSVALRVQIEQGAPADVFLSADFTNPQALVDGKLAAGPVTEYATNALTVIVPSGNPAGISTPADLGKAGVCVIAAGADVPITKYAEQVVVNLAGRPEYGSDFAARYEANICSREDNVGAVVNKIGLGEGDAAIVYVTDARAGQNVSSISLPADANVVATYGGVVLNSSPNGFAASEFLNWLLGSVAQDVLAEHGFGAAP